MKDFWGGFMKKRISCKVIKSIPLREEDFGYMFLDVSKVRSLISCANLFQEDSSPVTYTNKMKVEKDSINNNPSKSSIDFYA